MEDEDAELLDHLTEVLAQKSGQQNQGKPEKEAEKNYSHRVKPCSVKVQRLTAKQIKQLQSSLKQNSGNTVQCKQENTSRPNSRSSALLPDEETTGTRIGTRLLAQGSQRSESVPGRRSSRASSLVGAESIKLLMREDRSRSGSPVSLHSKSTRRMASENERSDSRASSHSSSKSDRHVKQENERPDSRASSHSSSKNKEEPEERKSRSKLRSVEARRSLGLVRVNEPKQTVGTPKQPVPTSKPSSVMSATRIKIEVEDSPSNRCHDAGKYAHLNLMLPVINLEKLDMSSVGTAKKIGPKSRTVETGIQPGPSTSNFGKTLKIGPKSKVSQEDSSDSDSPINVEEYEDSDDGSIIVVPSQDSRVAKSRSKLTSDAENNDSDSRASKATIQKPKIGPKSKMRSTNDESDSESTVSHASSVAKSTMNRPKIGPKSKMRSTKDAKESDNDSTVSHASSVAKFTVKRPKIGPKSIMAQQEHRQATEDSDVEESDDDSANSQASSVAKTVSNKLKIGPKSKMVRQEHRQATEDSDVEESDDNSATAQASSVAKTASNRPKIGPKSKIRSTNDAKESHSESTVSHASSVAKPASNRPKIGPKSKMVRQEHRQATEDSDVEESDNGSATAQASSVAKPTSNKPKIGPKSKMAQQEVQQPRQSTAESEINVDQSDYDSATAQASSVAKLTSNKPKIGPKSKMAQQEVQQPRQSTAESEINVDQSDDDSATAKASSVAKPTSNKPKIGPKSKMAHNEAQLFHRLIEKPDEEKDSDTSQTSDVAEPVPKRSKIVPKSTTSQQVARNSSKCSDVDGEQSDNSVTKVTSSVAKPRKVGPTVSRRLKISSKLFQSKQRKQVDSDNESIVCLDTEPDLQTTLKRVRDEFEADAGPSRKRAKQETAKSVSPNVQQAETTHSEVITKRCSIVLNRDEVTRYLQQQQQHKSTDQSITLLNLLYPTSDAGTTTTAVQTDLPAKQTAARKVNDTPDPRPKVSCVNLNFLKEPSPVQSPSNDPTTVGQSHPQTTQNIMCVFCSKRFPNSDVLQYHLMLQHPGAVMTCKNKLFCLNCKITFVGTTAFRKHQLVCGRAGTTPSQFQQARPHISQSPPEMLQASPPFNAQVPILCDVCGLNLPDSLSLTRHKVDVHSFKCDMCSSEYISLETLQSHRAEHHGQHQAQVPILCEICGLSLADNLAMARHKNETHNFGCDKCAMNFNSLDSFQNHRVEKHGYHRCPPCHLDFPDLDQLLQHVATTEHPYSILMCDVCHIKFTRPEFLIRHNAVRHNKGYFCMKCLEVFGNITKMLAHYEKCKKKINNVLEFADGNEVLSKQRRHTCDQCAFKCSTEANLLIHKESFHKAQLQCPHCRKFFTSWVQHNVELCRKNLKPNEFNAQPMEFEQVLMDVTRGNFREAGNCAGQSSQQRPQTTHVQLQTSSNQSPKTYSDPRVRLPIVVKPSVPQNVSKAPQKTVSFQQTFMAQKTVSSQKTFVPGTYMKKTVPPRPAKPRAIYKCLECRLEFPTNNELIVHNMSHRIMSDVMAGTYHCKYCNEEYDNVTHLTLHLKACWKNPKWNEYDGTGETTQEFAEVKLENYLSDEDTESAGDLNKSTTESASSEESTSQIHIIHTYFKCIHCLRLFENLELLQQHMHLSPEESVDKHIVMLTNDILKKLQEHCQGKPLQLQQNSQSPPKTIQCGNCSFKTTFECEMIPHCKTCKPPEVLDVEPMETDDSYPLFSNKINTSGPMIVECHSEIIEDGSSSPSEPLVIINEKSQSTPFIPEQSDNHSVYSVNSDSDTETQPPSKKLVLESSEKLQDKQSSDSDAVLTEIEPASDKLSPEQLETQNSGPIITSVSTVSSDELPEESSMEQTNQNAESVTNSVLTTGPVSTEIQESPLPSKPKEALNNKNTASIASSVLNSPVSTEVQESSEPENCDGVAEGGQNQVTSESDPDAAEAELTSEEKVTEEGIADSGKLDETEPEPNSAKEGNTPEDSGKPDETEPEPNSASAKECSTPEDSGKLDETEPEPNSAKEGNMPEDSGKPDETEPEHNSASAKESSTPKDSGKLDETDPEPNFKSAKEGNTPEDSGKCDTVSEPNSAKEGNTPEDSGKCDTVSEPNSAKEGNTQEDSGKCDTVSEPNSAKESNEDSSTQDDAVFEKIAEECTNSILQIQEKSMSSNSYGEEPQVTPMNIDVDESAVFSHEDCSSPPVSFNFHSPITVTSSCSAKPSTQTKHWDFASPLTNH